MNATYKVKKIRNASSSFSGLHSSYEYDPATYGVFNADGILIGQISGRWGGYMGGTTWELDAHVEGSSRWISVAPLFTKLRDAKAWLAKEGNIEKVQTQAEEIALKGILAALGEGLAATIEKAQA